MQTSGLLEPSLTVRKQPGQCCRLLTVLFLQPREGMSTPSRAWEAKRSCLLTLLSLWQPCRAIGPYTGCKCFEGGVYACVLCSAQRGFLVIRESFPRAVWDLEGLTFPSLCHCGAPWTPEVCCDRSPKTHTRYWDMDGWETLACWAKKKKKKSKPLGWGGSLPAEAWSLPYVLQIFSTLPDISFLLQSSKKAFSWGLSWGGVSGLRQCLQCDVFWYIWWVACAAYVNVLNIYFSLMCTYRLC